MTIPFSVHPMRTVPASGLPECRWTVVIRRGGSSPGSRLQRLFDAIDAHTGLSGSPLDLIVPVLALALEPERLARRVAYRVRHRTDWDVLVFDAATSPYAPDGDAALLENCATRDLAIQRAEHLWRTLNAGGDLPLS